MFTIESGSKYQHQDVLLAKLTEELGNALAKAQEDSLSEFLLITGYRPEQVVIVRFQCELGNMDFIWGFRHKNTTMANFMKSGKRYRFKYNITK